MVSQESEATYTGCFTNYDSSQTALTFSVLGSTLGADEDSDMKKDPVQAELMGLNNGLRAIRDEHAFLLEREQVHVKGIISWLFLRLVAKKTNRRIIMWFLIQSLLIGAVCYFQIRSLKRVFEVRRVV